MYKSPQIIFCSRTHSQLTQFVGELHRTSFADTLSLVALGSRKALCINESVTRLSSLSSINEKCMDMQKKGGSAKPRTEDPSGGRPSGRGVRGKKKGGRCPFFQAGERDFQNFKEAALAQPIDIEVGAAVVHLCGAKVGAVFAAGALSFDQYRGCLRYYMSFQDSISN